MRSRTVAVNLDGSEGMKTISRDAYIRRSDSDTNWGVILVRPRHFSGRRTPKVFSRRFYDADCGGKRAALVAARAWRDDIAKTLGKTGSKAVPRLIYAASTTGVPGVCLEIGVPGRNATSKMKTLAWRTKVVLRRGDKMRVATAKFSVMRYGYAEGFRLAVRQRFEWIGLPCPKKLALPMPDRARRELLRDLRCALPRKGTVISTARPVPGAPDPDAPQIRRKQRKRLG